jgi:hypothetical protein
MSAGLPGNDASGGVQDGEAETPLAIKKISTVAWNPFCLFTVKIKPKREYL